MKFARYPKITALALGLMSAFAFKPVGWWPLMPLAFAFLCPLVATAPRLRSALAIGWWFGVGQFVLGLNWIAIAFTFQANMPAWLGWIAVVLLSLYLAVYPMIAVGLAWRFGRARPLALMLALGGGWAVTEWLRATMFTGFAWNPVGVTLVDTPWLNVVRFVGTYGLSALVVAIGGAMWFAARRGGVKLFAATAVPIAALALVPAAALKPASEPQPIRIVQPNIGQDMKWDPGFEAMADAKLQALTKPRSKRDELVFWPEAAVTNPLSDNRERAAPMVRFERGLATRSLAPGGVLLTGGLTVRAEDGSRVDAAANSVFAFAPGGGFIGRYDKSHLVPYGEYLPMRWLLEPIGLSRLAPGDFDFSAGPGPGTLTLPDGLKAGFQVCYEIIFSGQVVNRAHRPDFLFNPSNDAWFGPWGPPQHLAQARLRAAEEGIPIIRSTPTGISALVSARGRVIDSIPLGHAGIIWSTLPGSAAALSPFARLGNAIPLVLGFGLLLAGIVLGRSRRYSTAI